MEHTPSGRRGHLRLVHSVAEIRRDWMFTGLDMIQIAEWSARKAEHGYTRSAVEGGSGTREETGTYILLYAPDRPWAVWGLARAGHQIAIWHCGSGGDLARLDSMTEALESLPSARSLTAVRPTTAAVRQACRKRESIRGPVLAFV